MTLESFLVVLEYKHNSTDHKNFQRPILEKLKVTREKSNWLLIFFNICVLHTCVYVYQVHAVPTSARRGHWIPKG